MDKIYIKKKKQQQLKNIHCHNSYLNRTRHNSTRTARVLISLQSALQLRKDKFYTKSTNNYGKMRYPNCHTPRIKTNLYARLNLYKNANKQ